MMSPDEVRERAAQQMGQPIPDEIWQREDVRDAVELVTLGKRDLNYLTKRLWEHLAQPRPRHSGWITPETAEAIKARSLAFARKAADDPVVRAFRREVLHDRLLAPDEVEPWIRAQEQRDGPPSVWITVPLPPTTRLGPDLRLTPPLQVAQTSEWQRRWLAYGVPNDPWVRYVAVRHEGVLDQLHDLSERLAREYGWDPAQATLWVLTGLPPVVLPIRAAVSTAAGGQIQLTVDPAVHAPQLATFYRRLLRSLIGPRRYKPLSVHAYQLASFALAHPELSWPERLRAWNAAHPPRDRYADLRAFRRAVKNAVAHVEAPRFTAEQVWTWAARGTQAITDAPRGGRSPARRVVKRTRRGGRS